MPNPRKLYHQVRNRGLRLAELAQRPAITCPAPNCDSGPFVPLDARVKHCSEKCLGRAKHRRKRLRELAKRPAISCANTNCDSGPFVPLDKRGIYCSTSCAGNDHSLKKYYRNHDVEKERRRAYQASLPLEERRRKQRKWRAENPDKVRAKRERESPRRAHYEATRRFRKRNATPAWSDLDAIAEIYGQAKGTHLHVDHIVPLCGKWWIDGEFVQVVSGLHVPENLRITTAKANQRKSFRFNPNQELPNHV